MLIRPTKTDNRGNTSDIESFDGGTTTLVPTTLVPTTMISLNGKGRMMDPDTIKQQTELEVGTLDQVANALRAAISWKVKTRQIGRKISTVRFVAQSFQRYLERLFALEEHDGYMVIVQDLRPNWNHRIKELRDQHDQFRQTIRRITTQLERITPEERLEFERHCHELLDVIRQIAKHNRRENSLLEDAFVIDDGGEG